MTEYDLLLVENSTDDAILIVEALRLYGVVPKWKRVEDRDALIAALEFQRWDAVLCDYSLPAMDAEDAIDVVREFDPELPFILVSGTVPTRTAVDLMRLGMHDYVLKSDLARLGPSVEREIREADHRRSEKSAISELEASRRRFASTFEQSAVGMAECDSTGRYLWVNQYFADILQRTSAEILGRHYLEFSHPDELSDQTQLRLKLLEDSAGCLNIEKRYLRKDGSEIWALVTVTAIRNDERDVASFVIVIQDITALRAAQNAFQRSDHEYRSLVETMTEGLVALDEDQRIIFANRSFSDIVGLDQQKLIGRPFARLVWPEDHALFSQVRRMDDRSADADLEWRLIRPDGNVIWVRSHHVPRYDDTGNLLGTLMVLTEITEQKKAEAEREQFRAQVEQLTRLESLGKLAGTIAHEFNNVLMGIQPFTEVIAKRSIDAKIVEAAASIRDSVNRGTRITREILHFARPKEPCLRVVNRDDLIRLVDKSAKGMLPANIDLCFDVNSCSDTAQISVDVEQLQQVFVNLIINARDAMPRGGSVMITATTDHAGQKFKFGIVHRPDRYVHFVVADTGTGIASANLDRIFEPMFSTKKSGTGLGLAVSHQIIKSHSGFLFVESTEGQGTSFHIFIPLHLAGDPARSNFPKAPRMTTPEPLIKTHEGLQGICVV